VKHRCESAHPLIGRDLPCANTADVEAAPFVALCQAPQWTPDEPAGEAEIAFAQGSVALNHLRAEVAQAGAEAQLIHGTGLAQTIVHDAGGCGIREAHGIDAHSYAHAGEHGIVQRRGAAEVRIVDPIGAAVVEVETADLRFAVEARLLRADAFAEGIGGRFHRTVLRRR
jgi:hypothetical protein